MTNAAARRTSTPGERDLGLRCITSSSGLSFKVLPNGCIFAIEHDHGRGCRQINLVQGSPLDGGIGRLYLRVRAPEPDIVEVVGGRAKVRLGVGADRVAWEGKTRRIRHRISLWLHPQLPVWLWRVDIRNISAQGLSCDGILVQDVGLGDRGFLMNNEAYASQYLDHHVARHAECGPVVMSRQNLAQGGTHPWVAHGCLDGAAAYATDAIQLLGPGYRDTGLVDAQQDLPGERLQHEVACAMVQSVPVSLEPGEQASVTFFGLYVPDHPKATSDVDLTRVDAARRAAGDFRDRDVALEASDRSLLQDAPLAVARALGPSAIARAYPLRSHEERIGRKLHSFFVPDGQHNRHVVLRAKEAMLARRHGTVLRSGDSMLQDEGCLSATCWMHGVFAAQLAVGNTTFHKLLSVSRDPYNITRSSGLRILVDEGRGWRLLGVPSAFEIGLSDCRWVYRLGRRTVAVQAIAAGDAPAMQWRITVEGEPCRLLVFGHVVLGERELDNVGRIEVDAAAGLITCRPDPESMWGRTYPKAACVILTATADAVEAFGGDELLHADGKARSGGYVAIRTRPTNALTLAVVGSLTDPAALRRLADEYRRGVEDAALLASAARYWGKVTRGLRIRGKGREVAALDTLAPWLAHNAMVHVTVAHGLEQYTGAAWGTRDVCQGPIELMLALRHDAPVREILRIVFSQQHEKRGDWPQWFMLDPYSQIRDRHSHGDVIVWPLKALCDYVEATGDLAILDEPVAWRRDDSQPTTRKEPLHAHADKLLATVRSQFIAGTNLIRYGDGDWNDSLQPADPELRDRMVSSWTVALLFQQIGRYALILERAGPRDRAAELAALAAAMREDFNRYLMRDGTVAGYAILTPGRPEPELLLHPSDTRTGLSYSLLPMTRSIIAGLFTPDQARHHLRLIREHLLFPDGARLMDRPVAYRGGPERVFRRAESAAFFGREIGLQYVHAHLRYGEALAALGEAEALWEALQVASPIAVTDRLAHASPRQRNAYFSSSDAAFADRYQALAEWSRVKSGSIAVDGGWRIYSSGPGLFINLMLSHAFGIRRRFGERVVEPILPFSLGPITVEMDIDGQQLSWELSGKRQSARRRRAPGKP